ncbi:HAMP domain-containing protein [Desulfovibrio sp. OttesenSCG-928-C06]|nr:HAMP domain-containing protein [Desulfovibrio sp. OttesenSCG-928-C06]
MSRIRNRLSFFWKVYAGAVCLICVVIAFAEVAEDYIPDMLNSRERSSRVLEQWLDRYEAADTGARGDLLAAMRESGVWFIDLPPGARTGAVTDGAGEGSARSPVMGILPESDDWESEWVIVDRVLPDGRLLAAGLPEPGYFDALEGAVWFAVIALFSGVCCYVFSFFITARLKRIVQAAESLSSGDLTARVPDVAPGGDEIARLGTAFNSMAGSIENLVENERRLLYDISHELRSPLARIRLALGLAGRYPDDRAAGYLKQADEDAERMSVMVESVIEQGRSTPVLHELAEQLDMRELVRSVVDMANFEFSGNSGNAAGAGYGGCVLDCRLEYPVCLRGTRLILEQAFYNVLSNALRYNPPGNTVMVEISAVAYRESAGSLNSGADNNAEPDSSVGPDSSNGSGLELVVKVRDFGPGVPAASLEKIFKPFYRVEEARDKLSGGTGLGLALARNYLERHNGRISAANANPGLLVTVVLPVFRTPAN